MADRGPRRLPAPAGVAVAVLGSVAVLTSVGALTSGAVPAHAASPPPGPRVLFRMSDPRISESSGLAASARHAGVTWSVEDGGTVVRVFGVDRRGRTVAVLTDPAIDPYDPEALAAAPGPDGRPALWVGDLGDNSVRRPDVSVFRIPEPARLGAQTVEAEWFKLVYPDGPHDAETLLVDPHDGRVWVATKELLGGGLYRAPARLRTDRPNPLERVADVPPIVTDGAFLPGGRFVLRTYTSAYVYAGPGRLVGTLGLPPQPQGESVCPAPGRTPAVLVGGEGRDSAVWQVPVPDAALTPPTSPSPVVRSSPPGSVPSAPAGPRAASPAPGAGRDGRGERGPAVAAGLVAAVAAAVGGGLAVVRRRRRH